MYIFSWLTILLCTIPGLRGAIRAAKEPPEARCTGTVWGLSLFTLLFAVLAFVLLHTNNLF